MSISHSLADIHEANRVMDHEPIALTDRHIAILEAEDKSWGSRSMDFATRARRRRDEALRARAAALSKAAIEREKQEREEATKALASHRRTMPRGYLTRDLAHFRHSPTRTP